MQFESWSEFFAMGGHGLYVWLAYGATFMVLAGSYLAVRMQAVRQQRMLAWSLRTGADQAQADPADESLNRSQT